MDLKIENKKLKVENKRLNKLLLIAKQWMEREIKINVVKIAKRKLSKESNSIKNSFFNDNIEDIITKKISDFFGEILLLNIPKTVIDNMISAEINYYNLRENKKADGLGVITSYHKALDTLIEGFITKGFRKFALKRKGLVLRQNDLIEKYLNNVVNKGYILGVPRLFHLVKQINSSGDLYEFGNCFKDYLDKYFYIKDLFSNKAFMKNFSILVDSQILGKKRHSGKINYEETKKARELIIGNFTNKDCFLYRFIEMGSVDI